ncbi:MAG: hypothetical protein ACI8UR_001071 [Natronomonas sp.]|jgi:hypothetical protein
MGHVAGIVSYSDTLVDPVPLVEYGRDKLTRRVEIITDSQGISPMWKSLSPLMTPD